MWGPTLQIVASVSREEIADLAGVDPEYVDRLLDLGILRAMKVATFGREARNGFESSRCWKTRVSHSMGSARLSPAIWSRLHRHDVEQPMKL